MKKLSSDMTWFMKYAFSSIWIGGFGLGTLSMFMVSGLPADSGDPQITSVKWFFLFALIAGGFLIYWSVGKLKKVSLEGDKFLISNFSEEIRVNVSDVKKVTGSILFSPELAWLHFENDSKFGRKIQFMPLVRFTSLGLTRHPIVRELNELINK